MHTPCVMMKLAMMTGLGFVEFAGLCVLGSFAQLVGNFLGADG